MKKSFVRALKDLHRLETDPVIDGLSPLTADALHQDDVPRSSRRNVRNDDMSLCSSTGPQLTSSTVGLYSPDEMNGEGFTRTIMAQAADKPVAQPVSDALTSWHGDTCNAVALEDVDAPPASALPSRVIISRILGKRDTQELPPGADGGGRAISPPKPQFAARIRSIPEDLDAVPEPAPNGDDCPDTRIETVACPRDGKEDILNVDALLEASKNKIIIIPRAPTFVNREDSTADVENPVATISADTIEPLPTDTHEDYLADDILVPPSQAYPEILAHPYEELDDELSVATDGCETPTADPPANPLQTGEEASFQRDPDEVPVPVTAAMPEPPDLADESTADIEPSPENRANATVLQQPREAARDAPVNALLTSTAPQLRTNELSTESPPPPGCPVATAFENELRDSLRQSTNLAQFQELAGRLKKGFSRDLVRTIAVAHLDEVQHALQVILSVARVLGMSEEIKTLLVDTDMNHKHLSKCFDVDCFEGFGEACDHVQLCPHLIRPTATPNVSILPAGNCADPTGPGLDHVRRLISALASEAYSVVLLDAGELLNPLTKKVCKAADAAHLLVRLGRTERAYAAQAIQISGIRFAGCIVTNVPQIN